MMHSREALARAEEYATGRRSDLNDMACLADGVPDRVAALAASWHADAARAAAYAALSIALLEHERSAPDPDEKRAA